MKIDSYVKLTLTVIAISLSVMAFRPPSYAVAQNQSCGSYFDPCYVIVRD